MKEKEFKERLEKAKREESRLAELDGRYINYRLLVFLAGILAAGLLLYNKQQGFAVGAAIGFISLFIAIMLRHGGIRKKLLRCRTVKGIYEDFLKRISGEWTGFSDNGAEFLKQGHPYGADLNIFGEKSLFQLLNLSHTFQGRTRLAQLLARPDLNGESIIKRQEAVKELSNKLDFIEELTVRGALAKKTAKDPEDLLNAIRSKEKVPAVLKSLVLLFGLPVLTILSAVFARRGFPWLYFTLLSGIILQLALFAWSYKAVFPHLKPVHQYKNELETYQKLLELIEKESFQSELLNELSGRLTGKGMPASARVGRLAAISDFIDFKYSPLIYFILNAFLLWDMQLYRLLLHWKKENAGLVGLWLDALGEFEALAGLSVMGMISPVSSYPVLAPGKPEFSAKSLSHPFIPYPERIANDISINGTGIITGSNMSGKTTLLRTVGINLVLAYAGAPVCAEYMRAGLMQVYTSMRNQDDLNQGISTFYAELLRIKQIVDYSRQTKNMIFLIDEIFKGTNSKDRIDGAKIVLRNLNKPFAIGLISTHDYELCDLEGEDPARFSNAHFTENYANNQIHFDYKLHAGRCRTSNARFLMRMVGLD